MSNICPRNVIAASVALLFAIPVAHAAPNKAMQKTWKCFSGRGNLTVTIGKTQARAKWSNGVVGVGTISGSGDEIKVNYPEFKRGSKKVGGAQTDTYTLLPSGKMKAKTRGVNFRGCK